MEAIPNYLLLLCGKLPAGAKHTCYVIICTYMLDWPVGRWTSSNSWYMQIFPILRSCLLQSVVKRVQ